MSDYSIPEKMKAIAIDEFGGIDELKLQTLPVPEPGPDEVLIQVDTAGVGVWDPPDREGKLQKMRDTEARFPYILGRDGAGTIVDVGSNVSDFQPGDRVYAFGPPNPEANLYAEYATEKAEDVALIPENLSMEEAGALATDAVTALCGLNQLKLEEGEKLLILGASGGLGHLAIQLAKRKGANVFAVASGSDGVALAKDLGADVAIDGREGNIQQEVQAFAPDGVYAALLTVGGGAANQALAALRDGGRAAYPHGVSPEPEARAGVDVYAFDGEASAQTFEELNRLIQSGPFTVHIDQMFPLKDAAKAHRLLNEHFLGRIALKVREDGEKVEA
jgi:NADPH:quinone reductase-like Zn-dependent oxidoreductase